VINNNNALGQILWEQMILGYPEHGVRYPQPFVDFSAIATANGAFGVKVERPGDLQGAISDPEPYRSVSFRDLRERGSGRLHLPCCRHPRLLIAR